MALIEEKYNKTAGKPSYGPLRIIFEPGSDCVYNDSSKLRNKFPIHDYSRYSENLRNYKKKKGKIIYYKRLASLLTLILIIISICAYKEFENPIKGTLGDVCLRCWIDNRR